MYQEIKNGNLIFSCCYSFEHDFVDEWIKSSSKELSDELKAREHEKSDHVNIVWNVKVGCLQHLSRNHFVSHEIFLSAFVCVSNRWAGFLYALLGILSFIFNESVFLK